MKKIMLVFFLSIIVPVHALTAQNRNLEDTKISLDVKDETLARVFDKLEQATKGKFIFIRSNLLDDNRRISFSVKNESLAKVLAMVLPDDFSLKVNGRQIIIIKKENASASTPSQNEMRKSRIITGRIVDRQNIPLPGAYIMVKDTGNGEISDIDGNFSIEVENDGCTLVISSLGFITKEISIDKTDNLNIVLHDDTQMLDEVVVIGYGTQTKASITGALSIVNTESLVQAPVASVTNVLSGNVPGVSTVQTSGQPGKDAASIYIRGTGSLSSDLSAPLVLVDGVERDFTQIDPNEIENMSVLKDAASTAVFGVRGANGVILITTRRGKEGRMSINASTNTGLQQPIALVEQVGSYEYARFWNLKMQNDGITDKSRFFSREAIEAYRTGSDPIMYPNNNWTKLVCNDVFLQSKNNINISGGSNKVKYFVSMGYLYQNGILKQLEELPYNNNYSYNRYNFRGNVDVQMTRTTTLQLNIGGYVGKAQEPFSVVQSLGNPWVFATIWAVPMGGAGFINGIRTTIPKGFIPADVELRDAYMCFFGYGYKQQYDATINVDAEINQKLDIVTKGLSLSLKGSYDNSFTLTKNRQSWGAEYQTAYYKSYLEDKTMAVTHPDYDKTIVYVQGGNNYPLGYNESYGRGRNWYIEAKLNYERAFGPSGRHKVSALLLYNQSRKYYPSSYSYIPRSYIGYVGRATYSYADKYYIDVNVGYNGSENFAPGKTRYGLFPSASIGWVMTEEKFMKKVKFINYLKLRASYGRVGNDISSTRFLYMPETWSSSGSYSFGTDGQQAQEAYGHSTPGNREVSWETSDKQNYGIDMSFLANRLSFSADWFFEHRTGILISPKSIPSVIAMTLPAMNIGIVDNHGYEIVLGWKDRTAKGFSYNINANMSYAKNKIVYMDEIRNQYSYQDETGGSTGRHLVYEFERIYQYSDFYEDPEGNLVLKKDLPQPLVKVYPGDAKYADTNKDGIVDGNDRIRTGYGDRPEYVFGLNAGFSWRGLNLSMQWSGATHVDRLMNAATYRIPFTNAGGRGLLKYFYEDCWSEENQGGTLPRAAETSETWNSEDSTLWLRDASYVRLKTVQIGYSFSGYRALDKIGVKSLGVSISGYNLLTFSPLKFMDPEAMPSVTSDYPLVKIYSLGLNITF